MKRLSSWVAGFVLAASVATAAAQFPTPIAQAIALLTSGVTTFTTLGMNASAYANWGTGRGSSGYGFRDNSGVMQVKNSGGSWSNFTTSGGAPSTSKYIIQTADAGLANAQVLGSLGTAILLNTTTTGVLTAYGGATCTNQFVRALSAIGAATCNTVSLTADITGTLGVTNGGTGLATFTQGDVIYASASNTLSALTKSATATRYLSNTGSSNNPAWAQINLTNGVTGTLPIANGGSGVTSGTSGGILGFTGSTTLASSVLLTQHAIVIGGGAAATPTPLASLGTTTTVLHGNASGDPTFSAVDISADTTGSLAANRGGTGQTSYTIGDLLSASAATTISKIAAVGAGSVLRSAGVATLPAWSTTTWPNSATQGDLLYASGANTYANLNDVAVGSYLRSGGVSTAPVWSALTLPNAATTGDLPYASGTNTLSMLADVVTGQVLISGGIGVVPLWSAGPTLTSVTITTSFNGTGTIATAGDVRLKSTGLIESRNAGNSGNISLLTANASDRIVLGSANATGLDVTAGTGTLHWNQTAPTISSGFGTTPSIAGVASAFRVTVGGGGDTSGVVLFATTWGTAPVCTANNETSAQLVRATPTTTQVTISGTLAASDKIAVRCVGF